MNGDGSATHSTRPSARLDVLPFAVAAILFATAIPIELRAAAWAPPILNVSDVVRNLLLYVPLVALLSAAIGAGLLRLTGAGATSPALAVWIPWTVLGGAGVALAAFRHPWERGVEG